MSQESKNSSAAFEYLKKKYDFQWEVLDIVISGHSSIDSSHGFQLKNLNESDRFIASYGYNLENPIERAQAFGNFHESLNFIRRYFLYPENPEGLKLEIPRRVLELTDIRELFLMASNSAPGQLNDTPGAQLKSWACSVLKVMHTVAHIDQDIRSGYFSEIQKQIFDRFYKVIHRDSSGKLFLGEGEEDPFRVPLVAFETKPKKSRDSILIKLLHKSENVAEDIFDRVGLRFVTEDLMGALLVVKFLKDRMIIMPPNIKPSRSRNSLVDLDLFRKGIVQFHESLNKGKMNEKQLLDDLGSAVKPPKLNSDNPHSSEFYRAIQFTARQLIKLTNPLYDDIRDLKNLAKKNTLDPEVTRLVEKMDLKFSKKEIRFFYPFEVQVVDQLSNDENEKGRSAHSEYKKAQLQAAMKRVMGSLWRAPIDGSNNQL